MHRKGERGRAESPLQYSIFLGGLQIPFRSLFPLFSLSSEKSGSSSKDGSFGRGMRSEQQFRCSQQRGLCQFCQVRHAFFPSRHPFTAHEINVVVINSKCKNDMLLYQLTAAYTRCTAKCMLGDLPNPTPTLSHASTTATQHPDRCSAYKQRLGSNHFRTL